MANNTERKKVIVRSPYYGDEGGHYLLTDDQIAVLHRMQDDGYIDDETEILFPNEEEEGSWELV